jgi:MerR family transcriptional regulator, thiopeptide resistance regulator
VLLRAVAAHDDAATLKVLEDDLALQRKVWTPHKEGYIKLAEALTEPSEWNAHLDSLDPRLPAYLRDAMLAFAAARME